MGDVKSIAARTGAVAGLAWAVLLVLAPLGPPALTAATYAAGSVLCHQRPERSFHLWGAQLPVCARCAGIYAGAAVVTAAYLAGLWQPAGRLAPVRLRRVLLAGCAPTVTTVALEWSSLAAMSNPVRAAAGLALGLAAASIVMAELHWMPRVAAGPLSRTHS